MWEEYVIAAIDFLFVLTVWPMVFTIWSTKDAGGHSLYTSVPFAIMFFVLAPLFWPISPLISVAHLPAGVAWTMVAAGTYRYRLVSTRPF